LGILFIGVGLSFGIFLYTLIKMKKYKKNIEMQQKGFIDGAQALFKRPDIQKTVYNCHYDGY
jgi:hypothetical protein